VGNYLGCVLQHVLRVPREPLQPRLLPHQYSVDHLIHLPWNNPGAYGWGAPLPYIPYGYPIWYMPTPSHRPGCNPTGFGGQTWGFPQHAIPPTQAADASTPTTTTTKKTHQPARTLKPTKKFKADGNSEIKLAVMKHSKVNLYL
jgi:hypothetical protein